MTERLWPSRLGELCGWVSFLLPAVCGLWTTSGHERWADDVAVVRSLGLSPVGGEGLLSMVLCQLAVLLPVGSQLLRAALSSVVALGVCSALTYRLIRGLLDRCAPSAASPLVACLAASLLSLSPLAQQEAGRIGGPLLSLSLLLLGVSVCEGRRALDDPRFEPLAGLVLGLASAESRVAGALLACVLVVRYGVERRLPSARRVLLLATGAAYSWGLASMFCWLRPLSESAWLNVPQAPSPAPPADSLAPLGGLWDWARATFGQWGAQFDAVPLGAAAAGLCLLLLRPRRLAPAAPFLALLSLGGVAPWALRAGHRELSELACLASCVGVAALSAVAASALWRRLVRPRWPLLGPAAPLGLALCGTLVLRSLDRAVTVPKGHGLGAQVFLEEALGRLPRGAMLLVRSETLAFRLLAARAAHGYRPDVVIGPVSLLGSGFLDRRLLDAEPEAGSLLRHLAVDGRADEYSLCRLADARPLFVELDPGWDRQLLEHLRPEPIWLGFSPHALDASERIEGLARSRDSFRRIVLSGQHAPLDAATRQAVGQAARQQALVLSEVGDRQGAWRLLTVLSKLLPRDPLVAELGAQLRQQGGGVGRGRP